MDPRTRPAAHPRYEIFEPETDLVSEEGAETFLLYLPDFSKEQLRVQLHPSRLLRISGDRPTGDNKRSRFVKEIRVPENCDIGGIVAKFDGGMLYIKQPKLVTATKPQDHQQQQQGRPVVDAPKPHEPRKEGEEVAQRALDHVAEEDERRRSGQNGMGIGVAVGALRQEQVVGEGIFGEMKKPENLTKLVAIGVPFLALALHMWRGWYSQGYETETQGL